MERDKSLIDQMKKTEKEVQNWSSAKRAMVDAEAKALERGQKEAKDNEDNKKKHRF